MYLKKCRTELDRNILEREELRTKSLIEKQIQWKVENRMQFWKQ